MAGPPVGAGAGAPGGAGVSRLGVGPHDPRRTLLRRAPPCLRGSPETEPPTPAGAGGLGRIWVQPHRSHRIASPGPRRAERAPWRPSAGAAGAAGQAAGRPGDPGVRGRRCLPNAGLRARCPRTCLPAPSSPSQAARPWPRWCSRERRS